MWVAPSMTWLLVRTSPEGVSTIPVPAPDPFWKPSLVLMSTTPGMTLAARAAVEPEGAVPPDGDPPPEKGLVGLDGVTGAAGFEGLAGTEGEAVLSVGRRPCQRHRLTTPAMAPTTKEAARAAASPARPPRAGAPGG